MARVQVSDEIWTSYRVGLGGIPVNVGLGQLVEREVGRQRRRTSNDPNGVRMAVEDARAVADELRALITRLERSQAGVRSGGPSDSSMPEDEEGQVRIEGF